jgi:hypothetical protein
MESRTGQLRSIGICAVLALALGGCAPAGPNPATLSRPDCVTLGSYSSVIEQVMSMTPKWEPIGQAANASQYQWKIDDESGEHTLTATLTPGRCVCATAASSRFNMAGGRTRIVGLLEGAAVAPVSDLNYTAAWLEPKVSLSCGLAYMLRRPYEAETSMKDGTTWKLTCTRESTCDPCSSIYTLKIVTPRCPNPPE